MIIFAILERRELVSVDFNQRSAQRLGGRPVRDALEPRNGGLAAVANGKEAPFGVSDNQFLMAGEAFDAVAEQLQPHLSLDAMRTAAVRTLGFS